MITTLLVAGIVLAQSPRGQIAFIQELNGAQRQVCLLDAGSGAIQTIGGGPWDGRPAWSPDGSQLAYENAGDDGVSKIQIVSPGGGAAAAIAHAVPVNRTPAWSPDGTKLAYSSGEGMAQRIRVYDLVSGKETEWGRPEEADESKQQIAFLQPAWESNSEIVAVGVRNDKEGRTTDLYEVERDAASLMVPTRGGGVYVECMPAVFARKGYLAYESNDGGDREVFIYAPQRGVIDMSNHRAPDWNPVWSPDAEWLAFESYRGGSRGIYKAAPQRTMVLPVVADPASDNWSAAWSPDGEWIAFVSTRTGKPVLHACRADGSGVRALTSHDGHDLAPAWRPAIHK